MSQPESKAESKDTAAPSRRDFIKTSTVAALGVGAHLAFPSGVYAQGSDAIRVGVIGCGGRGTGAARNVLDAAPDVRIVALADAFEDRVTDCHKSLTEKYAARVEVPADRRFSGFDAYRKVVALPDVNYIILAAPPGFRPAHLKAAIEAGKHTFTEKPVAVDAAGIREVLALYDVAKAKNLGIAAGTQRRHQTGYLETMKRLRDGAIGEIVAARCAWNQGGLWDKPRQASWSDTEWQLRNWLYFTWLSGDHIVEQHVHNLDVINWAMNAHPVKAVGTGGRQSRTEAKYGHVFDHFAVEYEYENGVRLHSTCRQQEGTAKDVSESFVGTKGRTHMSRDRYTITGATPWRFRNEDNEPYLQEHIDLIASLRAGKPINELKTVAESTLTAIMGRMSAYTGQEVTWEQALDSKEALVPAKLGWGVLPVPPVAVPGQTQLI